MTSKERANLRSQANGLDALFQVGKGGISEALIKQTNDALKARELIKIKVLLETSPEPPKEIARKLAEATESDVISVVGGSMIFYKYNKKLHEADKKKAKPASKTARGSTARAVKLKGVAGLRAKRDKSNNSRTQER